MPFCDRNGLEPSIAHAVNLALDELLTNTISYGYEDNAEAPDRRRAVQLEEGTLSVLLHDDAVAFDAIGAAFSRS